MPLPRVVTQIVLALSLVASSEVAAQSIESHTDRPGNDFRSFQVDDPSSCLRECQLDDRCRAWTYVKQDNYCMLKTPAPQRRFSLCCTSGLPDAILYKPVSASPAPGEPSGNGAWRDVR